MYMLKVVERLLLHQTPDTSNVELQFLQVCKNTFGFGTSPRLIIFI